MVPVKRQSFCLLFPFSPQKVWHCANSRLCVSDHYDTKINLLRTSSPVRHSSVRPGWFIQNLMWFMSHLNSCSTSGSVSTPSGCRYPSWSRRLLRLRNFLSAVVLIVVIYQTTEAGEQHTVRSSSDRLVYLFAMLAPGATRKQQLAAGRVVSSDSSRLVSEVCLTSQCFLQTL